MREIAAAVREWKEPYALAVVTEVRGSAPREPGAAMAVRRDGTVLGSVSGGCVEGSVYASCLEVLESGAPRVEEFGYSDADAFEVGLTCGGAITVHIRRCGGELDGLFGDLVAGRSARLSLGQGLPELEFPAPGRLLVFGAVDFAAALAGAGKLLGLHVVVCDARPVFATALRFPAADEVVVDWPHRYLAQLTGEEARTAVCVLTHDAKFDVPVLVEALGRPFGYIGAMGSRRTNADRLLRLRQAGVTEAQLGRLRAPIGLDLGARGPAETALSILAEVVAVTRGGSGLPLSELEGPVHTGGAKEEGGGGGNHGSAVSERRWHARRSAA